jgi:hypothetical protein
MTIRAMRMEKSDRANADGRESKAPDEDLMARFQAREDREAFAELVRRYERFAYRVAFCPYVRLHHLLDESTVFVAVSRGRIVGTVTTIVDSEAGLPMEALYEEEVMSLREAGRRPCEFCSVALEPNPGSGTARLLLDLFRLAYRHATWVSGASDVCITLKPSHAAFYHRLGFVRMGRSKQDPRFADADTIALRLSRESTVAFWSRPGPRNSMRAFCSAPMSAEERDLLSSDTRRARRSAEELLDLLACHPGILTVSDPITSDYLMDTVRRRLSNTLGHWTSEETHGSTAPVPVGPACLSSGV